MTQQAIVTREYADGTADVVVERASICGGDCSKCDNCQYENTIKTRVKNPVGARRGQQVYIETASGGVFAGALTVYILPLIFFFAGYAAAYFTGLTQGYCILAAFAALVLGAAVAYAILKRRHQRQPVTSYITSIKYDFD